ncbi:hypothetical protein [Archangium sp.]|uniref:hypothetical protein n=1 Tax=Archangium sp. TaxID=1872627 RepID=UPI002D2FD215|nr:hypothetical protein [Archangium sp.]HYO57583.1 hypothetical protein [Archangium sp.]
MSAPLVVKTSNLTLEGDSATLRAFHERAALDVNPTGSHIFNLSITGHLTVEKVVRDRQAGARSRASR